MHPTTLTSVTNCAWCEEMTVTKSYQHELAERGLE